MAKIGDREIDTPECDRVLLVQGQSQAIGNFLDWIREEKGIRLTTFHQHNDSCRSGSQGFYECGFSDGEYVGANPNIEHLIAEFYGIDLNKVEREKRALLDAIREQHFSKR